LRRKIIAYLKMALLVTLCATFVQACVTIEPHEGAYSESDNFEKVADKACVVTAIKKTKSVQFLNQDSWQDDHTQNFWGKRINSVSFRYAYSIDGIPGEVGHVVIRELATNDISFGNGLGHSAIGRFSDTQKDQIVEVVNEMNSNIKDECKISASVPKAKRINR